MATEFISLALIACISALAPLIARIIPRQAVPETVLLIITGAIMGPHTLALIDSSAESITLLSELGCAFLFLLAGYEVDPKSLTGKDGRHGLTTWVITFGIAVLLTILSPFVASIMPQASTDIHGFLALALLLTTTAIGALMPILKERKLEGTRVGELVISYGTWGELAPVLAVAVLLSTRSTWRTAVILLALLAICVWMAFAGSRARAKGHRVYKFLESKANTTSQTLVRGTILMLVLLVTFSAVFDLDIVLGSFAAGFVLRYVVPEGNPRLEAKLDGMGYGFFIPLFFVVSGCKIDLSMVAEMPQLFVLFIVELLIVRTVPIAVSLSVRKSTRDLAIHSRLSVALYCTTALPLIVAITSIAVKSGFMQESVASVFVAAGALSMFLMPLLGQIAYRVAEAEPIAAVREMAEGEDPREVIRRHIEHERGQMRMYRERAHERIQATASVVASQEERERAAEMAKRHVTERHDLLKQQHDEVSKLHTEHKEAIAEKLKATTDDGEHPSS